MAIHKLHLELSFLDAEEIVNGLRELAGQDSYSFRDDWLEPEYWQNPETEKFERNPSVEPRVKQGSVRQAERALERLAKYNRLITLLTGEEVDISEVEAKVAEGRRLLAEQEAAEAEAEKEDA